MPELTDQQAWAKVKPFVNKAIKDAILSANFSGLTISLPDNVAYIDAEQTFTQKQVISPTVTLTDGNSYAGLVSNFVVDPSGDSSGIRIGNWSTAYMSPGNANDEAAIWGMAAYGEHHGTGLVGTLAGIVATAQNKSIGNITTAVAVSGQIKSDAAGVITGAATLSAASPVITAGTVGVLSGVEISNQGAAGITLAIGLNIAAQSGATTNYAIYTQGGDIQINNTSTLTSGAGISQYNIFTVTPSAASSAAFDAINGTAIASGAENITGGVRGIVGVGRSDSTGTVAAINGVFGTANNNSTTGTVTVAAALRGQVRLVNSGATITSGYGVLAEAVSYVAGTLTSVAGIAIVAPGQGTNRTNLLIGTATIPSGTFSIYNSSTAVNYIAGNVGIGDTSPDSGLEIGAMSDAGYITLNEVAAPASPAANKLAIYAADNGSGVTKGYLKNSAGTVTEIGGGLDINGLSEDTSPDYDGDYLVIYDTSAGDNKKVLPSNLYVNKPACRVYHNANQSINNATSTYVSFNSEVYDTDDMHYTSSAALTGTVTKTSGSATIAGSGTSFTTELSVGQVISIPGTAVEYFVVTAIASNISLTVNTNAANTAAGQTATRVNSAAVIRTAGRYRISTVGEFATNGTGFRRFSVVINRSAVPAEFGGNSYSVQSFLNGCYCEVELAQWDRVEIQVYQSSGGALNYIATISTLTLEKIV